MKVVLDYAYLKPIFDSDGSDELEVVLDGVVNLPEPLLAAVERLLGSTQPLFEVLVPKVGFY